MKRRLKVISALILAFSVFAGVSAANSNCSVVFAAEESAVMNLTSAPNAEVRYNYSPTVACGAIRYISQMSNEPSFFTDYWGGWASAAGSECYTSCISMALSYIGINVTPREILDCGGGVTRPQLNWGGAAFLTDTVENAMANYINGNGKYSPAIIHLNSYSGYGHYVILAGQVSANEYQVIDPAVSSVWNITLNGNTATYTINGCTYTDIVTCAEQYYNSEASILDTSKELCLEQEEAAEDEVISVSKTVNQNLLNMQSIK